MNILALKIESGANPDENDTWNALNMLAHPTLLLRAAQPYPHYVNPGIGYSRTEFRFLVGCQGTERRRFESGDDEIRVSLSKLFDG